VLSEEMVLEEEAGFSKAGPKTALLLIEVDRDLEVVQDFNCVQSFVVSFLNYLLGDGPPLLHLVSFDLRAPVISDTP
jgi:hypothetical protein